MGLGSFPLYVFLIDRYKEFVEGTKITGQGYGSQWLIRFLSLFLSQMYRKLRIKVYNELLRHFGICNVCMKS